MNRRGQMIPRGDRRWLLRVYLGRDAENKRRYVAKTFEGTTAQARQELTKMLRESDTAQLVAPSKMTFKQYTDEWQKTKVQIGIATRHNYKRYLRDYILPHLGAKKLHEITPLVIQDVVSKWQEQGLAASTIHTVFSALHHPLEKAVSLGFLVRNPAHGVELPARTRREFTILSPEQMLQLFRKTQGEPQAALWRVLLDTGMRPQEALGLKWIDLDGDTLRLQRVLVRRDNGSYEVAEQVAKTAHSLRAITLSPTTLEALKKHRVQQTKEMLERGIRTEFVFATREGNHQDPGNVRRQFKAALKRAGLSAKVRMYDTRHSHATALLNEGNANISWVAERLGHTTVRTTERVYTRILPETHRQLANTMEEVLKKAASH